MSDVDILNEMIKDSVKIQSEEDGYGKKLITLTESDGSTHSEYSVKIYKIPENMITIKADAFKSPDTVFRGSHGECKRADFVIVADAEKKKVILCIEMKAKKDSESEIIRQLKGAKCFVAYCREIGKELWNQKNFLNGYAYRFISIGHISISKQKTRITRNSDIHDSPEKMLKISSPHRLRFNHLAGDK